GVQQGVPGVLHRTVPGAHHRRLPAGEHPGGDRSGGADPGLIGPCRERRGPRGVRAWRRGRPTGRPLPVRGERCGRAPGASGALAALATGLARIRRIGLTEAARALLTALAARLARIGGVRFTEAARALLATLAADLARIGRIGLTEAARALLATLATGLARSEEHTSELQSRFDLVCRL